MTHEAVRDCEERFARLLGNQIRRKRKRKVGRRLHVDEAYTKIKSKCCYLYRAIDRDGNFVDSMLSASRETDAAQRFFRSAQSIVNTAPKQVTTRWARYSRLGFGEFRSAQRFCRAFEEVPQYLRPRRKQKASHLTRPGQTAVSSEALELELLFLEA